MMSNADKNILITPNRGSTTGDPRIDFVGADTATTGQTISLNVLPISNGTLSFEGSAGQLFSITNDLTGTIFSVNDVSGIPSIEVDADGTVKFAEFSGNVLIGTATDNGTDVLQVDGSVSATSFVGPLTGNAATATALQTARTIGGVSFNGSANINLPGVNTAGNQNTTGNAATATTLQTARTINGVSFNGSANITVADATKLPLAGGSLTGSLTLTGNATSIRQNTTATWSGDAPNGVGKLEYHSNRWYINAGANSTEVLNLRRGGATIATVSNAGAFSGSAATLTTARTINGTSFNGSANITTANWGTARTINGSSINGSANVTTANWGTARTINGSSINGSANVTTANWGTARDINGTSVNGGGNVAIGRIYDTNFRRITNPGGAEFVTTTATVTGAIEIVYPVGFTNTMHRIAIKVYEYTTNESFEIHAGGYNAASGTTWVNTFAYIVGNPLIDRRFNVRFGRNAAGRAVIYAGEITSTWSHPQVFVTEFVGGFIGLSATWTTGWAINFRTAALENVSQTISNCQVGYAVSTNTANSNVLRNASGNFSAGTITAALSGNASTATTLQTARTINGVSFNGSTNITLPTVNTSGNQTVGGVKTFSNSVVSDDLKFRRFTTSTATDSHFRKYTDIIHYANSTSTVAGNLRIEIPVTTSTMWTMDVVIVEYDNAATPIKTTNLTITAYTTNNANRSVLTNNPDRISQVRFGRNTANNRSVILITPASTFRYPKAYIKEINTHHSNETTFNNSANYGITITTDESNFVLNGTVINNNFIRDTKLVNNFSNQTVAGIKTFSSNPRSSAAQGTGITDLTRRDFVTGLDAANVKLTTNQTVAGIKTFSGAIAVTGTLKAAGRFYAGTVNPSLTTRTNYDGHLHVNQLNAVGEVTAFSDRRLKDNIAVIVDPLTKILNIRGVTFTRIDQEDKDRIHMGVIAQEVEQYFPEVVHTTEDGTKTVNYGAMAGAFIEAFKAQQTQIDELRTTIEKLLNK